jgi:hypothetical protein
MTNAITQLCAQPRRCAPTHTDLHGPARTCMDPHGPVRNARIRTDPHGSARTRTDPARTHTYTPHKYSKQFLIIIYDENTDLVSAHTSHYRLRNLLLSRTLTSIPRNPPYQCYKNLGALSLGSDTVAQRCCQDALCMPCAFLTDPSGTVVVPNL